ncbi:hypothetical protein OGAPHI_003546 [Ogataea philodendri]|uniref:Alpha box domain-containing protein n=1 Tax=Ogataea philodendri TaxID=1378263 RepID=A0A9P8P6T6_9ASCO|nr:uncharacterized protein OGAPHI_003546 [Ogataea philodendri]KAH3666367.1 hypothetical protein OGAPHI_003546 [Ogataea philodendri]
MSNSYQAQILFVSDFPRIPAESPYLQSLLKTYVQTQSKSCVRTKRRKNSDGNRLRNSKSRRGINGFMAFRSYYSRRVSNYHAQKLLSRALAKAWIFEKNQDIWSRYAIEYNHSHSETSFSEWLQNILMSEESLSSCDKDGGRSWSEVTTMSDIVVEDVFDTMT